MISTRSIARRVVCFQRHRSRGARRGWIIHVVAPGSACVRDLVRTPGACRRNEEGPGVGTPYPIGLLVFLRHLASALRSRFNRGDERVRSVPFFHGREASRRRSAGRDHHLAQFSWGKAALACELAGAQNGLSSERQGCFGPNPSFRHRAPGPDHANERVRHERGHSVDLIFVIRRRIGQF